MAGTFLHKSKKNFHQLSFHTSLLFSEQGKIGKCGYPMMQQSSPKNLQQTDYMIINTITFTTTLIQRTIDICLHQPQFEFTANHQTAMKLNLCNLHFMGLPALVFYIIMKHKHFQTPPHAKIGVSSNSIKCCETFLL